VGGGLSVMRAGSSPSGIEIVSGAARIPHVSLVQDREVIGDFTTATGWTVLGTDTVNLAASVTHVLGTASLEFDKVDGVANTIFAGASNTLTSAVNLSRFSSHDALEVAFYVSATTDVAYAFVRLGTDVSNYNEWRIDDASITPATWDVHQLPISACELTPVGNGWNPSAVAYCSIGVAFDDEADALADIKFDHLFAGAAYLRVSVH